MESNVFFSAESKVKSKLITGSDVIQHMTGSDVISHVTRCNVINHIALISDVIDDVTFGHMMYDVTPGYKLGLHFTFSRKAISLPRQHLWRQDNQYKTLCRRQETNTGYNVGKTRNNKF